MTPAPLSARLTEGSVRRHLVALTLPMIWGLFAIMSFNLADTYFVGRLGSRELAAMSFTFPVVMVFISLAIGLGTGTSSVLARALGRGDLKRGRRLTSDGMFLAFLAVMLLTLAGLLTIDPLFRLLGATPDLLPLIRDYMQIWYLGIVFLVVPMVGMSAIRATGDSRIPGAVMVSSALVNIVLDPLLIFGLLGFPRLELQGAAIATLIARAMTFVIAFYVLHRRLHMLSFQWPGLAELKQSWGAILHVGLPAAGTNIILPLATAVIVALIAGFGTEAVAGFGAATRIEAMSLVIFYALSSVIGPVVGQNLGAGKRERILEAVRASAGFCIVYGLAAALLLGLFAEALAGLFSQSPTVIAAAAGYLTVVPISYGAAGIVMMASATFNGLGLPGKSVVLSMARVVLLQVPLAYLAAQFFGLMGIFLAIAMANLTVGTGAYLWSRHICARQGKAAAKEPVSDILPLP